MGRHAGGEDYGRTPTPVVVVDEAAVRATSQACIERCMLDPDGPGHQLVAAQTALRSQVDRWAGAIALAAKILVVALALLTASVTVAVAIGPSLLRGAISDEFERRAGRLDRFMKTADNPQLIRSAHAGQAAPPDWTVEAKPAKGKEP